MIYKKLRKVCEKSYFYGLSLMGKEDVHFLNIIPDPWPPNTNLDIEKLLLLANSKQQTFWDQPYFNSYEWVRDLKGNEDISIRSHIRDIIMVWIHLYHRTFTTNWRDIQWQPDVLGYRIWNWVSLFDFYGISGSESFKNILIKSLSQQFHHLTRCWNDHKDPVIQFRALKGIIGFLHVMPKDPKKFLKWKKFLEIVLMGQFLQDGGHISRNPFMQLFILRDLIDIRNVFSKNDIECDFLTQYIQQIAPVVRMFRHGDGTIARFNGIDYQRNLSFFPKTASAQFVDMCLSLADTGRRSPSYVDDMGYIRCVNQSGVLLFSTKPSFSDRYGTHLFDFEWSFDRQIILQSCDIVVETNAQKYFQAQLTDSTKINRTVDEEFIFIDALYKKDKVTIERKLYIADSQTNIRGEDQITYPENGFVAIRFKLAPDVEVFPDSKTTNNAILKLNPTNVKLKKVTTLQFVATRCTEILYEPKDHVLVLLGTIEQNKPTPIKWALMLNV